MSTRDKFAEEMRWGIESEGFDYYLRGYTDPEGVERTVGAVMPADMKAAWEAYEAAARAIERLVGIEE